MLTVVNANYYSSPIYIVKLVFLFFLGYRLYLFRLIKNFKMLIVLNYLLSIANKLTIYGRFTNAKVSLNANGGLVIITCIFASCCCFIIPGTDKLSKFTPLERVELDQQYRII